MPSLHDTDLEYFYTVVSFSRYYLVPNNEVISSPNLSAIITKRSLTLIIHRSQMESIRKKDQLAPFRLEIVRTEPKSAAHQWGRR